jgi:uridylate kinase
LGDSFGTNWVRAADRIMTPRYRRALIKVSGEALAGAGAFGFDPAKIGWLADMICDAHGLGCELGLVVGGGNILRGVDAHKLNVPRLVGDQMGMIATLLNAMALWSALTHRGVETLCMSAFPVGHFFETFDFRRARRLLDEGTTLIFAGGTGNPCFTTDSCAALRAVEIAADVMIKGTQVDGVYDSDPRLNPAAVMFTEITATEFLERRLGVMDAACVDILSKNGVPAVVLNFHVEGNIQKALTGEPVGTTIVV